MPIIQSFKELPEGPKIFWDSYGLDHSSSGVFVHASSIASELKKFNVSPVLMGNDGISRNFPDLNTLRCESNQFDSVLNSKLIRPMRSIRRLNHMAEPFIYHGLSNINLPLIGGSSYARYVLTVHDVIPLLAPNNVSRPYFIQFKAALGRVVGRAHQIICVSEWSARTLAERCPNASRKTTVISNGRSSPEFKEIVSFTEQELIPIVSVGRFEKYKNFEKILELTRQKKSLHLTIVTDQRGKTALEMMGKDVISQKRLEVFCQQEKQQMKEHYAKARVLVHMSEYEGFCLPAMESMTVGTPVAYLKGSGIDEVCGNRVSRAFDSKSSLDQWYAGIKELAKLATESGFRSQLSNHLNDLTTWSQAAKHTSEIYCDLLKGR